MTPFRGLLWSISKPSGIAGISAHPHVGDGHVGTVGKDGGGGGGGLDLVAKLHCDNEDLSEHFGAEYSGCRSI